MIKPSPKTGSCGASDCSKADPSGQIRDELCDLQDLGLPLSWYWHISQGQPGQATQPTVFDTAEWPALLGSCMGKAHVSLAWMAAHRARRR